MPHILTRIIADRAGEQRHKEAEEKGEHAEKNESQAGIPFIGQRTADEN